MEAHAIPVCVSKAAIGLNSAEWARLEVHLRLLGATIYAAGLRAWLHATPLAQLQLRYTWKQHTRIAWNLCRTFVL